MDEFQTKLLETLEGIRVQLELMTHSMDTNAERTGADLAEISESIDKLAGKDS